MHSTKGDAVSSSSPKSNPDGNPKPPQALKTNRCKALGFQNLFVLIQQIYLAVLKKKVL